MEPARRDPSNADVPVGTSDVPSPAPVPAGTGAVAAPPRRRRGTARDMVLSMLVILAVVAAVVLLLPRPASVEQPPVDVRSAAVSAAGQVPFEPVLPAQLPAGWKATSAYVEVEDGTPTWHIGYLTAEAEYAAVEMAADPGPRWVEGRTVDGTPTEVGERTVAGVAWRELAGEEGRRRGLLHEAEGLSTLVTGSAGLEELSQLAAAVLAGEPVPAP